MYVAVGKAIAAFEAGSPAPPPPPPPPKPAAKAAKVPAPPPAPPIPRPAPAELHSDLQASVSVTPPGAKEILALFDKHKEEMEKKGSKRAAVEKTLLRKVSKLHKAAEDGDVAVLKKMLGHQHALFALTDGFVDNPSPLSYAVRMCDPKKLPAVIACFVEHVEKLPKPLSSTLVEVLLEALRSTCAKKDASLQVVESVLGMVPKDQLKQGGGESLCEAAFAGREEVVKVLLDAGVDPIYPADSELFEGGECAAWLLAKEPVRKDDVKKKQKVLEGRKKVVKLLEGTKEYKEWKAKGNVPGRAGQERAAKAKAGSSALGGGKMMHLWSVQQPPPLRRCHAVSVTPLPPPLTIPPSHCTQRTRAPPPVGMTGEARMMRGESRRSCWLVLSRALGLARGRRGRLHAWEG